MKHNSLFREILSGVVWRMVGEWDLSGILTGGKTVNHSGSPCLERPVFPTLKQEVKQVMGWM